MLATLFLVSCEKEISIDLNSKDPKIVIEGIITDQTMPYSVKISQTVNFIDSNDFPPVINALVIIKDNVGVVDTLKQQVPGTYITNRIVGKSGVKYDLYVKVNGNEYFATSTMPQKIKLDDLIFNLSSNPTGKESYVTIPIFTDPAKLGDCYRFLQSTPDKKDKSIIVANDNINNGLVNRRPIFSLDFDLIKGDIVTIEMRCIDVNTYNYFYTLSQISGNGPGGGTTPSNPPNNITGNDALGYFTAYTTTKITKEIN